MLTEKITIYVPGTDASQVPDPVGQAMWVKRTLTHFATLFGGATADGVSQGAWMSETVGLVIEPIVKVYSFTDKAGLATGVSSVLAFAGKMAQEMGQEAVGVEVNNGLRFVYGTEAAEVVAA